METAFSGSEAGETEIVVAVVAAGAMFVGFVLDVGFVATVAGDRGFRVERVSCLMNGGRRGVSSIRCLGSCLTLR